MMVSNISNFHKHLAGPRGSKLLVLVALCSADGIDVDELAHTGEKGPSCKVFFGDWAALSRLPTLWLPCQRIRLARAW